MTFKVEVRGMDFFTGGWSKWAPAKGLEGFTEAQCNAVVSYLRAAETEGFRKYRAVRED